MPTWVVGNHDENQIHEAQAPLDKFKDIQHRTEWDELSSGEERFEAEALAIVAALNKALKDKVKCLHPSVVYDIVSEINYTGSQENHLNPPRTPQEWYDKFTNVLFRRLLNKNKFEAENGPHYKAPDPRINPRQTDDGQGKGGGRPREPHKGGAQTARTDQANRQQGGKTRCECCGWKGRTRATCQLTDHPDCNREKGVAWADSKAGKAWIASMPKVRGRKDCLARYFVLDGSVWADAPTSEPSTAAASSADDKAGSGNNKKKRPSPGGKSDHKAGGKKGKQPVITCIFAVTRSSVDGPTTPCLLLHPTLPVSKGVIHPFLDSMSRETVMSETLAHHLAVQGLARRPPSALLKEQVEFELADGTVVKPVDRAQIFLYSKVISKAFEIYPFVHVYSKVKRSLRPSCALPQSALSSLTGFPRDIA
jgi:hypothetical protein